MARLTLDTLTKRYKGETVLDALSLEVASGETLVLFGPSGAGKTVLLRTIAGAVDPDAGGVFIDGEDVTHLPPERRGIGMAFQNFALFPHFSAFENIASPLEARRTPAKALRERVEAIARLLKIEHVLGHAPRALSNGQKQRTALGRALAGDPRVLLLDDPLRNVDAKLRFEMRLELPRLLAERGATVLYVTQDYKEAMALGERIAVLDRGRIVQIGPPEEIYRRPATREIARLFGDPSINLLDVVPERDATGLHVRLSGARVALDPGLEGALGQPCTLGLRAEALCFDDSPQAIPVRIEAETPLNEKIVTLALTQGGREILISRPAATPGPASGQAGIAIEARNALLFERESGARIAPRESARRTEAAE
ncbi:MAG: ABC transporter ATP-binding protein [Pseudomonadota bacterium]